MEEKDQVVIGYARVSTSEQDLSLQIDALKQAGCTMIYTDKASGMVKDRPGLSEALRIAKEGDLFTVWKLDRLGRSVHGLVQLMSDLEVRNIQFRSLTDGIDTSTAAGRFFFHVMAAMAQMERDLIVERTKAGLASARERGRVGGRPKKATHTKLEAARRLLGDGMSVIDAAASLGLSRSTLYRNLKKDET